MAHNDHHLDKVFMQRALELALLGRGTVSPNPLVGSVVVHDGLIIGEGWHQQYGGPHAEVNAIHTVDNKELLKQSTVYVNLEPCSHFGKTPPCADMLIDQKVKKVVVANLDPNPLVAGEGIKKLRASGIEVITGILDKEGHELNKRFFTFMEKQRPYPYGRAGRTTKMQMPWVLPSYRLLTGPSRGGRSLRRDAAWRMGRRSGRRTRSDGNSFRAGRKYNPTAWSLHAPSGRWDQPPSPCDRRSSRRQNRCGGGV